MISTITSNPRVAQRIVAGVAFFAITSILSFPMLSHAAIYAYVNTDGDVRSVSANDWQTAIMIAPGRAVHSGVMLLQSATDEILGQDVSGV